MTNEKYQINTKFSLGFFALTAFIAIASRWLPHPPNFSALGGFLFFGGFLGLRNRFVLPLALAAMVISDLVLGTYPGIEFIYGSYLFIILLGYLAARFESGVFEIAMWNVWAAVLFFVFSNLGVYFMGGLYPQTSEGLWSCLYMGLPFFRNTLAAQMIFGMGFVYAYKYAAEKLGALTAPSTSSIK